MSYRPSFLAPTGHTSSSCGYCHSSSSTSVCTGAWAYELTAPHYQTLVDRGWRRSGQYCYRPALTETCCPALTIRCDVGQFVASKSQKKVIGKWRKFLAEGKGGPTKAEEEEGKEEGMVVDAEEGAEDIPKLSSTRTNKKTKPPSTSPQQSMSSASHSQPSALATLLTAAETSQPDHPSSHTFHTTLTPATYDETTYALYALYQTTIHGDAPSKLSPKRYTQFLVDSPLPKASPPDQPFGTFHHKYYVDDKLIAFAVLDILPSCLSSVYFVYDPAYDKLSLGTLSALKEIVLAESLAKDIPTLRYYYMGYYIHTCPKMRYKAQYSPSDLLCPATYTWIPTDRAIPILEAEKVAPLAELGDEEAESLADSCTSTDDSTLIISKGAQRLRAVEQAALASVSDRDVRALRAFEEGALVPFGRTETYQDTKEDVKELYALLGEELIQDVILVT
ncbi:hypothetical protein PhCBS80983_g02385 [Powellomyces hirtus]|uniref:Arginyl-tRNA--protein transferase 1 n=1 Tax=Powellomyces hirtus TaxID=109895 RepID=A0A507E605_9FUNG|nr:hypothetical protein PhCBS80983_g02385 [Powellomyces hirtus]